MYMDAIINSLIANGPIGAVLAFFMLLNYFTIKKLFSIIETNTKALTQTAEVMRDCRRVK